MTWRANVLARPGTNNMKSRTSRSRVSHLGTIANTGGARLTLALVRALILFLAHNDGPMRTTLQPTSRPLFQGAFLSSSWKTFRQNKRSTRSFFSACANWKELTFHGSNALTKRLSNHASTVWKRLVLLNDLVPSFAWHPSA